jgi:hypothetical protein
MYDPQERESACELSAAQAAKRHEELNFQRLKTFRQNEAPRDDDQER